jgi:nucleoside 2-deoxyribosyltransferase
MRIVYIAGPFRGPSSWHIAQNIRRAEELALQVWKMGAAALCPHANTANFQGAAPDEVWLKGDLALLERCDAILMTTDWERSAGARAEHDFAKVKGIPVFYSTGVLAAWLHSKGDYATLTRRTIYTPSAQ